MRKNAFDAGERRLLLRRIIVFGVMVFLLGVLQCSFFSRLKPFGATPDLVLGSIAAVTMFDGKKCGAVYAIAAGYFIDAIGALTPSFSPLFYLVCVVILGAVSEKMMPRFVSFAVLMLPTVILRGVLTFINASIVFSGAPPFGAFIKTALPEALCTFVFCLPIYFVVKLCMIPIHQIDS